MTVTRTVHAGSLPAERRDLLPRTLRGRRIFEGSLYRFRHLLFLYLEWEGEAGDPGLVVPELSPALEPWPGPEGSRFWVPLVPVFHFNEPVDTDHWTRREPVERRCGRVAFLKQDMVASYVYYHYQLQEERAFPGGKFESIYSLGTLLFQYKELPAVIEAPLTPGRLATRGTPEDWSQTRMDRHFQPWPDGSLFFHDAECLVEG